jgi:hypothetical protein
MKGVLKGIKKIKRCNSNDNPNFRKLVPFNRLVVVQKYQNYNRLDDHYYIMQGEV